MTRRSVVCLSAWLVVGTVVASNLVAAQAPATSRQSEAVPRPPWGDPPEWTAPWTAAIPMSPSGGPLFEYACHEGNHSVPNMLSGSRAEDAP